MSFSETYLLAFDWGFSPSAGFLAFAATCSLGVVALAGAVFLVSGRRALFDLATSIALFAFAFVALVTGFMTGNSRTTVTGDVLPVLLAGLGGLFMLGFIQGKVDRILMSVSVLGFSVLLLIGMNVGASNRVADELNTARAVTYAQTDYLEALKDAQKATDQRVAELAKNLETAVAAAKQSDKVLTKPELEAILEVWRQKSPAVAPSATPPVFQVPVPCDTGFAPALSGTEGCITTPPFGPTYLPNYPYFGTPYSVTGPAIWSQTWAAPQVEPDWEEIMRKALEDSPTQP